MPLPISLQPVQITLYFFLILSALSAYYSPVWVTNNYVRAGNENVISTLTGNNQTPTHTFTFSSAFTTGVPNLGYGIKAYQGNDYFGEEKFEVNRTALTASSFSVAVQILGVTNIFLLNVPYIAIDAAFPHHLNSFDNVPVNYGAGNLVNITSQTTAKTYYTNRINYTQQVGSSSPYNTFQTPLTRNKVLLFMTSLFIEGNNEASGATTFNPLDFRINSTVVSTHEYELSLSLSMKAKISKLHFSIIVFDEQDVEASGLYQLIYEKIEFTDAGGFIPISFSFIDNFIMGFTEWSSNRTKCAIHFSWSFQNVSGVEGVLMPPSVGKSPEGTVINQVRFTMFYMKTWVCPNQTYFDISQNMCTGCPIKNCLNCLSFYVCQTCDTANGFTFNSSTGNCDSSPPPTPPVPPPTPPTPTPTPMPSASTSVLIERSACNGFTIKVPIEKYGTFTSVQIDNPNISIKEFTEGQGVMTITAGYSSDIFGQRIRLRISPNFYEEVEYSPPVPAVYYSGQECRALVDLTNLVKAIEVISYFTLLLSIASLKIIGLELFGVLQLAYFTLASHSYFDLYLSPLAELRSSNGLNLNLIEDNAALPTHFKQLKISAFFLNNFNVMFFATLLQFVVGVVFYIVGKFWKNERAKSISVILLKQGFITFVFFNIFNVSFSCGIEWKYGGNSPLSWLNKIALIVCLVGVAIALILMELNSKASEYGQFKQKFKDTFTCRIYVVLSILYRISLGIYASTQVDYQEGTLIILSISLFFVLYNLINLPYSSAVHNYRANLCHITQLVILVTANYYRSMKSTTPMQVKAHLHTAALVQIVMIVACMIFSLCVLVAEVVRIIRIAKSKKTILNNADKPKDNSQMNLRQETMEAVVEQ